MGSGKRPNPKFEWGDAVRLCKNAPAKYQAGDIGSVCAVRLVDTAEAAGKFGVEIGEVVYLVELPNGEAMEVPEVYLHAV